MILKCPKCATVYDSSELGYRAAMRYKESDVMLRVYCPSCEALRWRDETLARDSKKIQGIKHSYERLSEATISRRGVAPGQWGKTSTALELERWQKHRNDKVVPLPGWMVYLGEIAGL